MSTKAIHCTACNGTRSVYKSGFGKVTCLDCKGRGFINVSIEEFNRSELKRLKDIRESERLAKQYQLEAEQQEKQAALAERRRKAESKQKDEIVALLICTTGVIIGWFFGFVRHNGGLFTGFFMQGLFLISLIGGIITLIQMAFSSVDDDK